MRALPGPARSRQRYPVPRSLADAGSARGDHPRPDRKSRRDHRPDLGPTLAQRQQRRPRSTPCPAALPAATVGTGRSSRIDRAAEDATATSSGTNAPARTAAGGRHLTLEHYESIGRISGALSQHAEEILTGLVGLEHVVERVFRTLAEIDKEGRAIRRALPFDQLCGEAGESEADVRRVVDRFQGDDCSFLVPSL